VALLLLLPVALAESVALTLANHLALPVVSVATLPGWKLNFQSPVYSVRAGCVQVALSIDQVELAPDWMVKVLFDAY